MPDLKDDLGYAYLAPEIQWRGGRVYVAPHPETAAAQILGHLELPPIIRKEIPARPRRRVATKPCVPKRRLSAV